MCDVLSKTAKDKLSEGRLSVPTGICAVDVDRGRLSCTVVVDAPPQPPPPDRVSDFWVRSEPGHRIYIEPRNRARVAEPNSAAADCTGAVFLTQAVRIDGLGAGSDLCLRTGAGHTAHIFFTAEIRPDSPIQIYYVTRK